MHILCTNIADKKIPTVKDVSKVIDQYEKLYKNCSGCGSNKNDRCYFYCNTLASLYFNRDMLICQNMYGTFNEIHQTIDSSYIFECEKLNVPSFENSISLYSCIKSTYGIGKMEKIDLLRYCMSLTYGKYYADAEKMLNHYSQLHKMSPDIHIVRYLRACCILSLDRYDEASDSLMNILNDYSSKPDLSDISSAARKITASIAVYKKYYKLAKEKNRRCPGEY
jgi:hypothetical protein